MASLSSTKFSAIALGSPLRKASAKVVATSRISFSSLRRPDVASAGAAGTAGAAGFASTGLPFGGSSLAQSDVAASRIANQAEMVELRSMGLLLGERPG